LFFLFDYVPIISKKCPLVKGKQLTELKGRHKLTDKIYKKGLTMPKKDTSGVQIRDSFQTPRYAIDLLIPFIPKHITHVFECAAGGRKISGQLIKAGYTLLESDIKESEGVQKGNFISDGMRTDIDPGYFSIITNPPFSIKDLFIERAFEYGTAWAMLINADYSQKTIDWIERGCEKIIPKSRIAYITPNILRRIHEGEIWNTIKSNPIYKDTTLEKLKNDEYGQIWPALLNAYKELHNYKTIDETPQDLLYRYSNAQFHSMWLTFGFGMGRSETFVDLPVEQRRNNI
jgi:hypothetical protein